MQELLLVTFTFGVAIFTFLSMLEVPVWKLIFTGRHQTIPDSAVRFVHRNLRFMTSKLPAANGGVILAGVGLMVWQAVETAWSAQVAWLLGSYLVGLFLIVIILKNPKTVFSIRAHESETADIDLLLQDLNNVGRDHHIGLALNLFALIYQLVIIWS
ncbi:MAG: hypothetical protein RL068_116 [Actinomycetota bacterium]|jgi:hypothetical protein